jgi:hypothetical protein
MFILLRVNPAGTNGTIPGRWPGGCFINLPFQTIGQELFDKTY